jgi:hypothetical protein
MRHTTPQAILLSSLFASLLILGAQAQPTLVSADPHGNPNGVVVVYSTAMDATSSGNTANYTLANTSSGAALPITSAVLQPDQVTVRLGLGTSMQATTNYTLTIKDVKDAGLSTIAPNPTVASFYLCGPPGGVSFTFDDGVVPANSSLATLPALTDGINAYEAITNTGGFQNSGCLILVSNAVGQSYGQWQLTNDLANGSAVSSFSASFKMWMVNKDPASAIGNGMIFHVGPRLPSQYTGGASSWGNGLDLNFRNFNNNIIPPGVNIWWYPPYTEPSTAAWQNQGGGGTIPSALPFPTGLVNLNTNWLGYIDTNGASGDFSNYVTVNFSVTNGVANLTCSNALLGSVMLFSNVTIPTWTPIIGGAGGSGLPANFAFTSTDGSGNHGMVILDDIDLTVNGVHVAGNGVSTGCGPVAFTRVPASVTTNENVFVNFSAAADGAGPFTWQWFSNSVPIPGANGASYQTPWTLYSNTLGGTVTYTVAVSNDFSYAITNAVLTLTKDTNGVQVLSVGSMNGSSVGVMFSSFVDVATAGNPANYLVNGVQPTAATVRTAFANFGNPVLNYAQYQKTVLLTPASPVGSSFTVQVRSGVLSRTSVPVVQTNLTGTTGGLADVDLGTPGTDPLAAGETFVGGSNQVEIIGGGSDIMPIVAGASVDHAHYAYLPRTGNFDVIAQATWETPTMAAAKAGLMVRSSSPAGPTDAAEPALSMTVFPLPGRNTYETAVRSNYNDRAWGWAATGVPANGNLPANWPGPNWIRIRRLGPKFTGYSSTDGSAWYPVGSVILDTNTFPPLEYIGPIATAANNDGRLCEADFSSFGPLVYAGAVVTLTNNLKPSYNAFENGRQPFTVGAVVTGSLNALQSDIVYQWQRAEPSAPTVFGDIIDGTGNTNTYTTPILTVANDNGAKYRVIAYVGDMTAGHSVTSVVATLNVALDTTPPFMVSASADATFLQISINFDGPMDTGSAGNSANYTLVPVGGGSAIGINSASPTLSADGVTYTNVVLSLASPLSPGVKYTLTLANVLDTANNNINNTSVTGGKQRIVSGWVLAYGYLKYERWNWPAGGGVTDVGAMLVGGSPFLSNPPDVTELITYSGYPNGDIANPSVNILDFGARISGFFIPQATASYSWYLRGNDGCAIWISGDNNPPDVINTLHKAAYNRPGGYAAPGASWIDSQTNLAWVVVSGNFPDISAVSMTAGQPYALSVLEKQGTGTSWLEFTAGTTGTTVLNGESLTNTAGGAYPTGTAPARGGAPTNTYYLKGTNIATYVNPDVSVITANGPTNTTVVQYRFGFLAVVGASAVVSAGGAVSSVPVTYQWMSNGIPLVGATNATYTTPMLTDTNHTITYSAVLSVPGLTFMTITNNATVTVVPDITPPVVQSASSFGGNTIGIRYQELMDAASATNAANYTGVSGGLSVTRVVLRPDGQTVLLYLSGTLAGPTFSVTINNVKDIGGNLIAPNTQATGNVVFTQMTALDIGVGTNNLGAGVVQTNATLTNVTFDVNFPGSTVAAQDGVFETVASGQGYGLNTYGATNNMGPTSFQDGIHFLYEQRTGDFDVKVRIERIDGSDARAKAGLMMRAALTPGALEYLIGVEPAATNSADGSGIGFNGVTLLRRQTNNSFVTVLANNPAPPVLGNVGGGVTNQYPIWLRIRRTGSSFYFYTGADGTNWYLCGRSTGQTAWPATTYVGMATTAANMSSYTQSRFAQYGNFVAPSRPQVLLVGLDNSITGSGPADNPSGNPNATNLWITADTYMYNLFVNTLGYSVTVVADATSRAEDATGVSLIFWDGTSSSANLGGTPSTFTWAPVPIVQAKDATLEKEYWVKNATDRGGAAGQTTLKIVNTNNPIVKGLYQIGQNVQVNTTGQTFTLVLTNNPGVSGLGSNFVVVATTTTNSGVATIYYADKATNGLWLNAPTNYIAHRRVGLWLGDGNSGYGSGHAGGNPAGDFSTVTSDGLTLLLNAIKWAIATNELPAISNQPANQFALVGNSATFSVTPGGPGGPFTYQWYKNNLSSPISGATYADYVTPATVLGDSGSTYQVVVSGPNGSVTSSVAILTVLNAPGITSQPQNAKVATNHSASFSVTATSGGGTLTYQWFSNAVLVAGATAATYNTPLLPLAASGAQYYVTVANQVSALNSATAIVTVVNPPVIILSGKTLTWSGGGNLQAAINATGPYTNVPGATSPYTFTVTPGVPQLYYRVQQ